MSWSGWPVNTMPSSATASTDRLRGPPTAIVASISHATNWPVNSRHASEPSFACRCRGTPAGAHPPHERRPDAGRPRRADFPGPASGYVLLVSAECQLAELRRAPLRDVRHTAHAETTMKTLHDHPALHGLP